MRRSVFKPIGYSFWARKNVFCPLPERRDHLEDMEKVENKDAEPDMRTAGHVRRGKF